MARWRLYVNLPDLTIFSDFFMTKGLEIPISVKTFLLKWVAQDLYVEFFLNLVV